MLLNPKPRREPRGAALGPLFDPPGHHADAGR
jgi:hypothetical protein